MALPATPVAASIARAALLGLIPPPILKDQGGDYVEVTGDLDLGPGDRLDTRRKVKIADKTTISIGATAQQISEPEMTAPDATLVVDAFTTLGERCPKN